MKLTLPSGPATIGPAAGAFASNVHSIVLVEELFSELALDSGAATEPLGVAVAVAVGVRVGHAGHALTGVATPMPIGGPFIPPELTLMQAHPVRRPVYTPPFPV